MCAADGRLTGCRFSVHNDKVLEGPVVKDEHFVHLAAVPYALLHNDKSFNVYISKRPLRLLLRAKRDKRRWPSRNRFTYRGLQRLARESADRLDLARVLSARFAVHKMMHHIRDRVLRRALDDVPLATMYNLRSQREYDTRDELSSPRRPNKGALDPVPGRGLQYLGE